MESEITDKGVTTVLGENKDLAWIHRNALASPHQEGVKHINKHNDKNKYSPFITHFSVRAQQIELGTISDCPLLVL